MGVNASRQRMSAGHDLTLRIKGGPDHNWGMRIKATLIWMAAGFSIALFSGCGKSDSTPPSTKETTQAIPPAKPEPASKAESVATPAPHPAAQVGGVTQPKPVDAPPTPSPDTSASPVKELTPTPAQAATLAPDTTQGSTSQPAPNLASLSNDQMIQALQEALAKGLQQAVSRLGHEGGFLTNLNVKIPMPDSLKKLESAAHAIKQEKLVDDFVTTMNHAAEQAVPEAAAVFAGTLKQLTIDDAKAILTGPNDAATKYFQRATQTNLYNRFYPIVQIATQKTGVTAAYKTLTEKVSATQGLGSFGTTLSNSLLGKDSTDIDAYVTNKALDGLFKLVAEEEQRIRQSTAARTTDVLQKVFGALKR
jgi:hypothetical protein